MKTTRLVLVAALLLAAGCRKEPLAARIDPALIPLIPSSAQAIAGIRLDKLKNTEFYRRFVEGKQIPMLEEFAKRTGLDPRKDLWELCVIYQTGKRPFILARGKFGDLFGLEPRINIEGMRRMSHKGYNILGTPDYAVMFLQSGVAVAGDLESLHSVVDNRDKPNESIPQPLLDLVAKIPARAQFWMVTDSGGALVPNLPTEGNAANFTPMIQQLRQFTVSADLTDDLRVNLHGEYPDPLLAKRTHDAIRALAGVARLQTPDDKKELLKAYDGLAITAREKNLDVAWTAPLEFVETVMKFLPK